MSKNMLERRKMWTLHKTPLKCRWEDELGFAVISDCNGGRKRLSESPIQKQYSFFLFNTAIKTPDRLMRAHFFQCRVPKRRKKAKIWTFSSRTTEKHWTTAATTAEERRAACPGRTALKLPRCRVQLKDSTRKTHKPQRIHQEYPSVQHCKRLRTKSTVSARTSGYLQRKIPKVSWTLSLFLFLFTVNWLFIFQY